MSSYDEYKNRERARLKKEDQELARQEAELDRLEKEGRGSSVNQGQQSQGGEGGPNKNEHNENDDYNEDDPKANPEDENPESEGEEGENQEGEEGQQEDENSEDDKDDSEENDENNVNSEDRKNLGPNRGQKDEDEKDKSKDDDKKDANDNGDESKSLKDKAVDGLKNKLPQNATVAKVQQLANKAIAAVKGFMSFVALLGKLLVNPIFWIVIAIIIILIAISASVSVIGGNDYNKACEFDGVGSVNIADDADDNTRQAAIAAWLMSTPFDVLGGKGMTKEQAAGVLGNLIEESYGANPKAIQGDHSLTRWETCDNDCVAAFSGGGKAVGILQWDGAAGDPRRDNLVALARSEGKQWYDLDVQLKHIKNELDGIGSHTYENTQIKKSGFLDPGRSVDEYTTLWAEYIERCGKCRMEDRIASANDFYNNFQGGNVGSLATQCIGGSGSVDASSLVQLALQISYSREEKAAGKGFGVCSTLVRCGDNFSKPEFITAKQLAEEQTGTDGFPGLTASCDRLVATLVRLTGMDTNFPWGGTSVQIDYLNNPSNGWVQVSCQERQPGDVIIRPGHVMIYIGVIDGRDTISSASIALASRVGPNGKGRAAHLSDLSCKGDTWYADAGNADGWRKVN